MELRAEFERLLGRATDFDDLLTPPTAAVPEGPVEGQMLGEFELLGTIGRGGLAGMLIGSTAERTIAKVTSSVVAVKPDDFVCPIKLD